MRVCVFSALLLLAVATVSTAEKERYVKPAVGEDGVHLLDVFESKASFGAGWVRSEATRSGADEGIARYDGTWAVEEARTLGALRGDRGLVMKSAARHYGASAELSPPFDFGAGQPLLLQYEVRFQDGMECGGAYVKLLQADKWEGGAALTADTPYTVMFGPDKCGTNNKVHFILQFRHPLTGELREHHLSSPPAFDATSPLSQLFTLVLSPDNTFEIRINDESARTGALLVDLEPPISPPATIADPADRKPADWVDEETVADPEAIKPADWDDDAPELIPDADARKPDGWLENAPVMVADPEAVKPADWDDDEDGDWVAPAIPNPDCARVGCGPWMPPQIPNPAYRGPWHAPRIANPAFRGAWKPREIDNPDYFVETDPFRRLPAIAAAGFELWSVTPNVLFDNLVVASRRAPVKTLAAHWRHKVEAERVLLAAEMGATGGLLDPAFWQQKWFEFAQAVQNYPYIGIALAALVVMPVVLLSVCCRRPANDAAADAGGAAKRPSGQAAKAAKAAKAADGSSAAVREGVEEGEGEGEEDEEEEEEEEKEGEGARDGAGAQASEVPAAAAKMDTSGARQRKPGSSASRRDD